MIPFILILLLLTGCGGQATDVKWVSFPAGVDVTWKGMTYDNPKAKQIWLNAETCVGHAQGKPELIIVNGSFHCGDVYPADGCSSLEKGIVVVADGILEVNSDYIYYHEDMHILLNSHDEKLVRDMAAKCKAKYKSEVMNSYGS